MNPRRYPRTMADAFGPYTDHRLHPMPERKQSVHPAYGALLAVVLGIVLAALLFHGLSQ